MDVMQLMKQAQDMKKKMEAAQAELANESFEAESGWGMVKAVVNGRGVLKGLTFKPEFLQKDPDFIEETIIKAVNQAMGAANKAGEKKIGAIAGPLKGLMGQ